MTGQALLAFILAEFKKLEDGIPYLTPISDMEDKQLTQEINWVLSDINKELYNNRNT